MIRRFSSRRERLDKSFLFPKLVGARGYDRVAGYFTSSILEVGGEAIDQMAPGAVVRVVCNSDLHPQDVATARLAQVSVGRAWSSSHPEKLGNGAKPRFQRLHALLSSGRLQVKVLPMEHFGLLHGKAGVITQADGSRTSFLGSMNETREGWQVHYELLWEDDSAEAVAWVQKEFDDLWNHPDAVPLGEVVLQDIERLAGRTVFPDVPAWRQEADITVAAAAPVVEAPVYRDDVGLWEHQKYFVELAFRRHRSKHGARLVLADQVGLGKTIQLGMVAQLIALDSDEPKGMLLLRRGHAQG